jgi:hypothetical protein
MYLERAFGIPLWAFTGCMMGIPFEVEAVEWSG